MLRHLGHVPIYAHKVANVMQERAKDDVDGLTGVFGILTNLG